MFCFRLNYFNSCFDCVDFKRYIVKCFFFFYNVGKFNFLLCILVYIFMFKCICLSVFNIIECFKKMRNNIIIY